MVPVLNSLHIQAAVYGNHDFGKSLKRVLILHCKLYYILSQIFSPLTAYSRIVHNNIPSMDAIIPVFITQTI